MQLREPYQDFLWFVQPREAAFCLNDAWQQRLQLALKNGYVFVLEGEESELGATEVIDRYEESPTSFDEEDTATVPYAAEELPYGYGESCAAGCDDVAVVPGDEEEPFCFHGDMEMYRETASSVFNFIKPGHDGGCSDFEGELKPQSRHPSLSRAFSNESGYDSEEEFAYSM